MSGWIADRIGIKISFVAFFVVQVAAMALLYPSGHLYWACGPSRH
jgi:hypothetical protein